MFHIADVLGLEHQHPIMNKLWGHGYQTNRQTEIPGVIHHKNYAWNRDFLLHKANQVGTGHKLHFQPKNQERAKLAAINNKNGCGTAKVWYNFFPSISYHWCKDIRWVKKHIFSVVPPTKSAQVISSIFSPKIQLGPNWQQSTTKMAVARLRWNSEIADEVHIIDTIVNASWADCLM